MKDKRILGILLVLVLVGGFVIWNKYTAKGKSEESSYNLKTDTTSASSDTTTSMLVEDNAIAAAAEVNSRLATASMVQLAKPGYVIIHEDLDGKPGNVIGESSLLQSGKSENVEINLTRATVKGERLYAMVHVDNGDGNYTEADQPASGENGEAIMMYVMVGDSESPGAVSL